MKEAFRRLLCSAVCCAVLLSISIVSIPAAASNPDGNMAIDISADVTLSTSDGVFYPHDLRDKLLNNTAWLLSDSWVTLEYPQGIGSLYLLFHLEYSDYTVTNNDTGEVYLCSGERFLHDFLDLESIFGSTPTSVTISFPNGDARLNEIYAFTSGEVPAFVQRWEQPADAETDLLLFSTHGDDEQLFFAGLLPYYAGELDYQVQVVYLTDHRNTNGIRIHEMLNGLWAVGVKTYPVFGEFDDFRMNSMERTYDEFAVRGWSKDELLGFVVQQLRRFKPLVAVGHDIYGEYGHGQHMVYTDLLMEALEISNDAGYYPESADKYGLWDVPKTYLHLYWENQILMDWDRPLENFDGLTAFEVTKFLGFPCHVSQQGGFGYYFRYATKTSEVPEYSPAEYGLYRSTVGPDLLKNDFFENLTTYAQQEAARIEAEQEAAQQEAERIAAEEEAARQEAERIAAEQEAARIESEEKARQELQIAKELASAKNRRILIGSCAAVVIFAAISVLFFLKHRKKRKENSLEEKT